MKIRFAYRVILVVNLENAIMETIRTNARNAIWKIIIYKKGNAFLQKIANLSQLKLNFWNQTLMNVEKAVQKQIFLI